MHKHVTYRFRHFIDKHTCIDTVRCRTFRTHWVHMGLHYFRQNEHTLFTVAEEDIIFIEE